VRLLTCFSSRRGCAHCGRGGSPSIGDGAFETRFSGMRFTNSSQRAFFRHPNEAFLYDLDGTLTGTGVVENYTLGGKVRGSSLVGSSVILPALCTPTSLASGGTGGSICTGVIFRRVWFKIASPALWVGKALCVRTPNIGFLDRCQSLQARCSCLPYLKMAWMGNVFLAAEGQRYSLKVMHCFVYSMLAGPSIPFGTWCLMTTRTDGPGTVGISRSHRMAAPGALTVPPIAYFWACVRCY
jgi:hypothetical protein